MARSPIMHALRRLVLASDPKRTFGSPTTRSNTVTRRQFVKSAALIGVGASLAGTLGSCARLGLRGNGSTRIAIVGAGLAGLVAAWQLTRLGHSVRVFDSSNRFGGRVFTVSDAFAEGVPCEFGGEFIDSDHTDMLRLATDLELDLVDMQGPEERELIADAWYFGGRHYTDAEILAEFLPLTERLRSDAAGLGDPIDFEHPEAAGEFDKLSVAEYIEQIGTTGMMRSLLNLAYTTEYGLDTGEQSALNLLTMLAPSGEEAPGAKFEPYGGSDERFKIRGGNHQISRKLAERIGPIIELEHTLVRLRSDSAGHHLTFEKRGGGSREVSAEWVILALPFTMLRRVEIEAELHPAQLNAIKSLGYGTNSKVLAEFDTPTWRSQGMAGNVYSDLAFQTGWDNSRGYPRINADPTAGYTFYLGGARGRDAGAGIPSQVGEAFSRELNQVFPGVAQGLGKRMYRMHWPAHPHTRGSYSCYRTGQWTSLRGAEAIPCGTILFAGEHTSLDWQGFMNGAAESGRVAAEHILTRIGHA